MNAGERTLGILGCGTMGGALAGGLLRAGWMKPERIRATTRREDVAGRISEHLGIDVGTDNMALAEGADTIVLCLKPDGVEELLRDEALRGAMKDKLVISIAAGVSLDRLCSLLPDSDVIRAMPNTPCLIGRGMTVLARRPNVADDSMQFAGKIFSAVGRCVELEPKHMNAVTSLNGSGPAFAYVMLEAMADGGVMMGLPRDVALTMAAQVFRGAAAMVLDTHEHPAALKDQVTTPAGCTIAGLLTMEDGRIRSVLARTIQEATKVAASLGSPKEPAGF